MQLSLFFFPAEVGDDPGHRYDLLLECARYADDQGLTAIWLPERHFDVFGGLYPNPAIAGAAVAAVTRDIGIRAGSVAIPLHHVVQIVEDWSVVDNLSGGRVGISLAPGWSERDFVLAPGAFGQRKETTLASVAALRQLWRGEPVAGPPSAGGGIQIYPPRVSAELPLWLTSGGSIDTFLAAGTHGTGVLTHLMSQRLPDLAEKITGYRSALAAAGSTWPGHVTLMVHAFVASGAGQAAGQARPALERYLITAMRSLSGAALPGPEDGDSRMRLAVRAACDRYLAGDGLFGPVPRVIGAIRRFEQAGVDELACLIDFGLPADVVLAGLRSLAAVRAGL